MKLGVIPTLPLPYLSHWSYHHFFF